jgi:anti-anti-sigma factor
VNATADCRYCLRGEVDLANAARIRADLTRVISTHDAHLLVDCTYLTFIDSTGIAVLLEANRKLEESGRYMLVFNVPDGPRRTFDALGLTDLLRYDRPHGSVSAEVKQAASILSLQIGCPVEAALAKMCEQADDAAASIDEIATAVLRDALPVDRRDQSA